MLGNAGRKEARPSFRIPTGEMTTDAHVSEKHAVVLFDGVCTLCNGAVNFVIDRDPEGYFKFGALQSDEAQPFLDEPGLRENPPDSIVLLEGGGVYRRSTAALRIARHLSGGWPLLYGFVVVPRVVRDAIYDWIAEHRYQWFGKRDQCRVPTPELQERFLK